MGFFAFLEVDNGESLSIDRENGINVGKPLISFLEPYSSAITHSEGSPKLRWFSRLEEQSSVNLRVLTEIYYGEDMLYSPDEYDRFIAEWGRIIGRLSEAEFKKRLEDREKTWTPIVEMLPAVEEVVRLLPQMGEDTHWYVAENTRPAFQALLDTLKQAQNRGGKKVRILIR
ncbi:MAG: hypothetical protein A2W35_03345 [Chloroflexi bacterium RBG_16_57_11]|nr:MAG: hypothetical protein A2W35_03345 [Chloroflexi bacterium RBG_16_57_11]